MKQNVTNLSPKISNIYNCNICDYTTCKIADYKKHILTIKHKNNDFETNCNDLKPKVVKNLHCICGTIFNNRTTLWRHKKKCGIINNIQESISHGEMTDKELIIMLVKENSQIELDDLENTGRTNYIEGISNIVIKNLNKLEQHMRPLHCSDLKREVLYIKDNNEWTKETETKPILTKAIKTIANQNIKQISKWKDNYPDCTQSDSKKNDLYLKIVSNSMNGLTKEEGEKNINKIINNVAKNVVIEK